MYHLNITQAYLIIKISLFYSLNLTSILWVHINVETHYQTSFLIIINHEVFIVLLSVGNIQTNYISAHYYFL